MLNTDIVTTCYMFGLSALSGAVVEWKWIKDLYRGIKRRVWRYQRGNQNPYIEEEETTQWPKEKGQKDKQWSIKHYT